jgi:hypothetical protein
MEKLSARVLQLAHYVAALRDRLEVRAVFGEDSVFVGSEPHD